MGLRPRLLTVHRFAVKLRPGFEFRFSNFDRPHAVFSTVTKFENRRSETGPQGGETLGQPLAGLGQALRGSPTVGLRPRLLTVHRFAVKVQPGFEFRISNFDRPHTVCSTLTKIEIRKPKIGPKATMRLDNPLRGWGRLEDRRPWACAHGYSPCTASR